MIKVTIKDKFEEKDLKEFSKDKIIIGRATDCDIILKKKNISKHHAEIILKSGRIFVKDLNSTNGTEINNKKINAVMVISPSDIIKIGDYYLKVESINEIIENETFDDTKIKRRRRKSNNLNKQEKNKELTEKIKEFNDNKSNNKELIKEINELLKDKLVNAIMINNNQIYIEKNGNLILNSEKFESDDVILEIINQIIEANELDINLSNPLINARLKDGSYINIVMPPISLNGIAVTIRKFKNCNLSIDELIKSNFLTKKIASFLEKSVKNKKNIFISGVKGSGKTTLLNILAQYIPKNERIVTIENFSELQIKQTNFISLEAFPCGNTNQNKFEIKELLKNALNMFPQRIIIGECEGNEVFDVFETINKGYNGFMSTICANTTKEMLSKLEIMLLMSGKYIPKEIIQKQIVSSIDIIIQLEILPNGSKKITSINEIKGIKSENIELKNIFN